MNTECRDPPSGNFSNWAILFSFVPGELWTSTKIEYKCFQQYGLEEEGTMTCDENGDWSSTNAPKCKPSF